MPTRARHAVWVVGAQALGQLSMLAAIPVLTRNFDPSTLGLYQVANSLALVLQPVASVRVEFLIPVAETQGQLQKLLRLSRYSSLLIALTCLALTGALNLAQDSDYASVALMTGVLAATYAWIAVENALLVKTQRYGALAARNVGAGLLSGGLQILVALFYPHVLALAAAVVVGRAAMIIPTRVSRPRAASAEDVSTQSFYGPKRALTTVTAGVLSNTVLQALTLLAGSIFGSSAAGYTGTAQRIAGAPASFMGQGIGQFVQGSVAQRIRRHEATLSRAVLRLSGALAVGAFALASAITVAAPLLAEPVLGPAWGTVGTVVAILAWPACFQLAVGPMNPILVMIGQERLVLRIQALRLLFSVGTSLIIALATNSFIALVVTFASVTVAAYAVNAYLLIRRTRQWDRIQSGNRVAVNIRTTI